MKARPLEKGEWAISQGVELTIVSPLKVSIDKKYLKRQFEKIFQKWEHKLNVGMGLDIYEQKEFLQDLLNSI